MLNGDGTVIMPAPALGFTGGSAGNVDTFVWNSVAASGEYLVRVGSVGDLTTGSYLIDINTTNGVNASDDNSSFTTSTKLGTLGTGGVFYAAQIEPQSVLLPTYPGSEDEPGHRQIQAESHGAGVGVTPTLPAGIAVMPYSFPPTLGSDLQGNPILNLITEEEKQITRQIFEIFASLSGIEFQETLTGGLSVAKGDIASVDPGSAGHVGGISGGGVVIEASLYSQANREFGDGFTGTMFHELGHAIGLGHAYDLPSIMGSRRCQPVESRRVITTSSTCSGFTAPTPPISTCTNSTWPSRGNSPPRSRPNAWPPLAC